MQLESVGLMISKWLTLPISQKSKADFLTAHDLIRFNHILNLSFLGFEIKKKKPFLKIQLSYLEATLPHHHHVTSLTLS